MPSFTVLLLFQLLWLGAVAGQRTVCPANFKGVMRSDVSPCKGLVKNPESCCQSLRKMEIIILSASYNNGSADVMKIVGSPSYNNACRNMFRTVIQKKGVTVDVFGLCSGYWLFPLAEKNITESTCPLTSYEDVGSVVNYRSLSASCNNAKCSNPSTQASTSACGQSILEAAIMLTENDSQISDCYYVVTMRLAQAHFKSVYKSVFFLCDAVPPLANASINLTAIYPPPPVAAPPVQGPDASAPSPSAKPSSPAPAPAPSSSPNSLVAPSAPAPAPLSTANSSSHAPSSAPSPAPASSMSPAPAPSPSPTNKTIGVPGSLNEPQEPS
ncbi:unnamed protein product, partial [Closterium sp. Naga37s-1]